MNYLKILPIILATSLVYAANPDNSEGGTPAATAAKGAPPTKGPKPGGTPQSDTPKPGSVAARLAAMKAATKDAAPVPAKRTGRIVLPGAVAALRLPGGGVPGAKIPKTKAQIDAARGALTGHGTGTAAKNPESPLHNDETKATIEGTVDAKASAGPLDEHETETRLLARLPSKATIPAGTRRPPTNRRTAHQAALAPAPAEAQVPPVIEILEKPATDINALKAAFDKAMDAYRLNSNNDLLQALSEASQALTGAVNAFLDQIKGK